MRLLLFLSLCVLLNACDSDSSPRSPERPQELPAAFEDVFGETWTCLNTEETSWVQGRVRFTPPANLSRADILHLSLVREQDGVLHLVATHCVNNMLSAPVHYRLHYNAEMIDTAQRYFVVTTLFQRQEDNLYVPSLRPDGYTEVINNGVVNEVDIVLQSP